MGKRELSDSLKEAERHGNLRTPVSLERIDSKIFDFFVNRAHTF